MKRKFITRQICKLIMDNTKELLIFFQRDGLIIDYNKATEDILEYGEDIRKTNISDIFREAINLKDNCLLMNSKYKNKSHETMAYKQDQSFIYVELKIIVIEDSESFFGLCIASDMTVQKKLIGKVKYVRNDMKQLLKLKNIAVENIIHELRTPVSGIMGMSEILLDMDLNTEQSDNVQIIYQSCKGMNSLINGLFDVVRMKQNKPILNEQKFNFYLMIDKVIKYYRHSIKEKQLKLSLNISKDIPAYLIGDEFRLAQIIDNLLSNAIKFTHDGEVKLHVSMTSYKENEVELLFMVIDTGIGIDDKEKEKIFMSYYKVDGSTTRNNGGVGIGLSICKKLAKAMGGEISVESTRGKGSTFSFVVKLKTAPANKDPVSSTISKDTGDSFTMTKEYDYRIKEDDSNIPYDDKTLMDMLKTTIEQEDWQYAEGLALRLRDTNSNEDKIIANKMLQLLFSIRKEEQELSLKRIEELNEIKNMHHN